MVLFSVSLTRAQLKDRAIRAEIAKLEQEVNTLEEQRAAFEELISLVNNPEFLEKAARKNLGYTLPGEEVVVIEENVKCKMQNAECEEGVVEVKEMSNLRKWWMYFFERD